MILSIISCPPDAAGTSASFRCYLNSETYHKTMEAVSRRSCWTPVNAKRPQIMAFT